MRSVFHVLPKFLDLNKIYSSMLSTKTINCVVFDISFLTQPRKCEQLIHLNIETKYFYGLRQPWGLLLLRSYRFNLLFSLWAPTLLTKFSFGTWLFFNSTSVVAGVTMSERDSHNRWLPMADSSDFGMLTTFNLRYGISDTSLNNAWLILAVGTKKEYTFPETWMRAFLSILQISYDKTNDK